MTTASRVTQFFHVDCFLHGEHTGDENSDLKVFITCHIFSSFRLKLSVLEQNLVSSRGCAEL